MKIPPYIDTLFHLEWGERHFGSLVTNRVCTRRSVMRCVRAGLAKSKGLVVVKDGNGFTVEPERYREGFVLTAKGKRLLATYYHRWEPARG